MQKNKIKIIYQIKTLFIVLIVFCSFAVLNISFAQSFIGPSCAAGQCQGKIGVDSSGNVSMGTSTPQSGTKTLIISQTSDSSTYGLRVLSSNNSPLLLVRSDGQVSIATSGAGYALTVSGDIYASGNLIIGGSFSAPISAGNVTPGVFNSLQGGGTGAYAFLGSLGIATSSQVGLPQSLSVYGGGYFSGNVGIGTTNPGTNALKVVGDLGISTDGSTTGAPRVAAFVDLSSGEAARFQFGDPYNAFQNAYNGRLQIYSYWGIELIGSRQSLSSPSFVTGVANDPSVSILSPAAARNVLVVKGTTSQTGDLQQWQDSAGTVLAVVKASGNVGIGTTTPAYKLDVVGQINSSGGLCIAGDCKTSWSQVGGSQWTNTTGGIYYLGNVGIGTSTVSYPLFVSTSTDTLFAIQRTGASSPTIFKQGTDSAFVINNAGSDVLTIKSGNVGIGTTTPSQKLTVGGTVLVNLVDFTAPSPPLETGLYIQSINSPRLVLARNNSLGGPTNGIIDFGGVDNGSYVYAGRIQNYSGDFWFYTQTPSTTDSMVTPKMTILTNGNVGIGKDVPGYKLDVAGIVNATDFYKNGAPFSGSSQWTNTTGGIYYLGNVGIGTSTVSYPLFVSTSTANLFAIQNTNSANPVIFRQYSGTFYIQTEEFFSLSSLSGVSKIGFNVLSGNVSIGTSTSAIPTKLYIEDNTNGEVVRINNLSTTGVTRLQFYENGVSRGGLAYSMDNDQFELVGGTGQKLAFFTNNAFPARMTIDLTGNVGIGTTSPAYKLDVAGDIRATGSIIGTYAGTVPASNVTAGVFGAGNFAFPSSLGIATSSQVGLPQTLSVYGGGYFSGNVGIGTTTPPQKLTVAGNIGLTAGAGAFIGTLDNFDLILGSNNTNRIFIKNDGNIGIGTSTPNRPFHIFSTTSGGAVVKIEEPGPRLDWLATSATTDNKLWRMISGSSGAWNIAAVNDATTISTNAITINRSGTTITGVLFPNSNVGIGMTSNPTRRLAIVDTGVGFDRPAIDNLAIYTANTERMRIDSAGNVGIGTTTPAYKLDVSGDIRTSGCLVYNGGTLGTCASDIRLKDNIMDLTFNNAIEKVIKLQPKKFVFKQDPNHEVHGLIAQEVEEFAPELVTTDQNGYKQIKYGDIQWLMLQTIQEQQKIIENQQKQIDELKNRIEILEKK